MKESYRECLASNSGLEPYAGEGNLAGVASARGDAGQLWSSPCSHQKGLHFRVPTLSCHGEGNIDRTDHGKGRLDAAESENLGMCRHSKRENREILLVSAVHRGMSTAQRNGQKTSPTVMLT